MDTALIQVQSVRQVRERRTILSIDELSIAAGEHVSVLGPNGAGKTTLLRLLAGVDRPRSGRVLLDGADVARSGVEVRRRVAYATQRPGLLSMSARRNVELPLRWRKLPRAERRRIAMDALERLGVAHLADRAAGRLSGGEQQRVNLARALALDPAVLLLDEPASGLDAETRSSFFTDLSRALADRATTVVHVSHRAEEAYRIADRLIVLVDGRIHQIGTGEQVTRSPGDPSVATLVGYENVVDALVTPEGSVEVGGAPTGLKHDVTGPVAVAVFAAGVKVVGPRAAGVPMRVRNLTPGPGHRVVELEGAVPLVAHLSVDQPVPVPGETVRVRFDPAFSAVLPTRRITRRSTHAGEGAATI